MRVILKCILVLILLQTSEVKAASAPEVFPAIKPTLDSSSKHLSLLNVFTPKRHKKVGFFKKLEYKILEKKIKKLAARHPADDPPKKNVLSTISLILGLIGAVSILISSIGIVSLIAGPAALITGIIALGKHNNNSKASRIKAIIGLTLGGIVVFIWILAIILFFAWAGLCY